MTLPDRRPTTIGQPTYQPTPIAYPIEPYRPGPIAYVPDPYNPSNSVAVPAEYVQAPAVYQPRDLTPQPLFDPVAQRVMAGGIGAGAAGAGVGWGVGQAFAGIAAFGGVTSLAVIAALLLVARLGGSRTQIHNETHVTNTNRWLGRSTTNTHQR